MRLIPFELIRIICCCLVVSIHFGYTVPFSDLAVPMFVLIAFYFSRLGGIQQVLQRSVRIYKPFILWGIIGFAVFSVGKLRLDWPILFSQVVVGAPANAPLYFLWEILVFSWIVWFLSLFPMHWHRLLAGGVVLVSLIVQYAGVNYSIFSKLDLMFGIVFGRGVELMPYAMLGWYMSGLVVRRREWLVAGVGLVGGGLMLRFGIPCLKCSGFGCEGLDRLMLVSGIGAVAAIPKDWLSTSRGGRVICVLSGLTAGIYYMHKIIGGLIARLGWFSNGGVWLTVAVIICTGICCFAMKRIKYLGWMVK